MNFDTCLCVTFTSTKVPKYDFRVLFSKHCSYVRNTLLIILHLKWNNEALSFFLMIQRATPHCKFKENCLTLLLSCYVFTSSNSLCHMCVVMLFWLLFPIHVSHVGDILSVIRCLNALTSSLGCTQTLCTFTSLYVSVWYGWYHTDTCLANL